MQRLPWISVVLSMLVMLSPPGQEIFHSAFYSGEQLARSMGQLVLYIMGAIMLGAVGLECLVRWWLAKRRGA
jgi:hypothetical protein